MRSSSNVRKATPPSELFLREKMPDNQCEGKALRDSEKLLHVRGSARGRLGLQGLPDRHSADEELRREGHAFLGRMDRLISTCHMSYPPSEIDWGLVWAVFAGSEKVSVLQNSPRKQ